MSGGWSDAFLPAAALALECAAVVLVARRLARRIAPDPDAALDRAVVGLLLALTQVIGVLQFLGMLGALRRGPVVTAHVMIAIVALQIVRPVEIARLPPRRDLTSITVVATGLWLALVNAGISLNGRADQAETFHYHLPNAAFWLRHGSLWDLPYTTAGYFTHTYPSNGELVGLWAILPTHDDRFAYVTPLVFGVLAVLAGALIARELGGRAELGALASMAVLAAPLSFGSQTHSMLVDWAAAAGVATGVGLALVARRRASSTWVALSALAFGGLDSAPSTRCCHW